MTPVVGSPPRTPKEDERLRALALSRISVAAMAEQMKRSKAGVRNRARRLKIVVAKSRLGLKRRGNSPSAICLAIAAQQAQPLPAACAQPGGEWPMIDRPIIARSPWTPDEDAQLQALAISGKSAAAIAAELKRTEISVRSRASKLRVLLGTRKAKGK